MVSLPFYSGVTEPIARALNAKGIATSISARGSLRENLVKPKDKLKKEQSNGLIYHIPCAGANNIPCPGTYVGETERTAQARFKEHTSTAVNAQGKFKSAMLQHARDNNHHFRKEDVSVLSRESDWVRRGIKEAIYIKALNPSINIDPGRHALSTHFDSILKSSISAPPPPRTHNDATEARISTAPRRQGRPRNSATRAPIEPTLPATIEPQRRSQRLQDQQQRSTN